MVSTEVKFVPHMLTWLTFNALIFCQTSHDTDELGFRSKWTFYLTTRPKSYLTPQFELIDTENHRDWLLQWCKISNLRLSMKFEHFENIFAVDFKLHLVNYFFLASFWLFSKCLNGQHKFMQWLSVCLSIYWHQLLQLHRKKFFLIHYPKND